GQPRPVCERASQPADAVTAPPRSEDGPGRDGTSEQPAEGGPPEGMRSCEASRGQQCGSRRLGQWKKTSATPWYSAGSTVLSSATASDSATRTISPPWSATIWPNAPSCTA